MSRLRIYPPVATIYPNDRQLFTAEATSPPAMWVGVGNSGDVKSDFSLEVDPAGSTVSGFGAHWLFSGLGFIEFTIDDQCRPTSSNQFVIQGFISDTAGFEYGYTLRIDSTNIDVLDETATQIYTEAYATLSGDVYRIELSGAGFRLYRNDVLRHARVSLGTTVIYPMSYQCFLTEATAAAPTRIPPPRLIGDWKLSPVVQWTALIQGLTSATAPAGSTEYTAGPTPGAYTLVGQIESAADAGLVQRATATIIVPALQVLGPSQITLQPSEKVRFKTNYDAAVRSKLTTWSVVSGGGSFTQDEFTAPSTPGASLVRVTSSINNLSADITATVPPVITNANNYTAAKASEQIDFETNIPASVMPQFVSAGAIVEGTGPAGVPLPPGFQADDIFLMFLETANEAVTPPSGWAAVPDSSGTGTAGTDPATRISVLWRRATFFDGSPTVADPGDHIIAQILAFRGCPTTGDPWDVTSGDVAAAATTAVSIPGDTTTVANCLVVLAVAWATDTATPQASGYTNADLANITERTDVSTISGNGGGFAVATGEKATAGAYGATTATLATSSVQGRMSLALKPGSLVWTVNGGSINSSSGLWTAPSLTGQTAKITVGNGIFTVTIDLQILNLFPFDDLTLPVSWDRNLSALISMSEDRTSRITRDKALPFDSYPIKLLSRTLTECNTVGAFFDLHGFGKAFILEDAVRGIRKVGWFDSAIRHEARDECDIDLTFQFLEARL